MNRRGQIFLIIVLAGVAAALGVALLMKDEAKPGDTSAGPSPAASATDGSAQSFVPPDASPAAQPEISPVPPRPTEASSGYTVWEGPDEAVASFKSSRCGRMVLVFGSQQYAPGPTTSKTPPDTEFLGYQSAAMKLWGNRASPKTLYITENNGKTFEEWNATDTNCS